MHPSGDDPDQPPEGWTAEEASDDARSWLGADERVLCVREGDGWAASVQPRGELGTAHQVPLTDGPTEREAALSSALEYMEANGDAE